MVDFNPNADYSVRNRKVDGEKTGVRKQNGLYYVQNEDGSYSEIVKTRKGNIFHKARFTRKEPQAFSIEKAPQNTNSQTSESRFAAYEASLEEINEMKELAQTNSRVSGFSGVGELDEWVVTPTSVEINKIDKDIAFEVSSADEWVITPKGVHFETTTDDSLIASSEAKNPESSINKDDKGYLAKND